MARDIKDDPNQLQVLPVNYLLSADCTPAAETFRKLSPYLGKWEGCDPGGKHRARYCHLLLAPV